ncbi:UDP-N-acetylmuramate dehydrogenase [Nitrosomonas nitrosa]|uniref:UDP-N-acetylenolpyruvoylglucosamine reductase n=2 Tax=Nitrosomonas nitrosa TaxID=52442 RepID=A0A1I4NIZ6_9PROT|nr:UDP-N-acetylmuramate dehydrogenase [Nitrosomonas nitrosa]SFM15494.1 UDP-N-acetylmuramate dehydrogenase [Nitrosomonas nitrosa]
MNKLALRQLEANQSVASHHVSAMYISDKECSLGTDAALLRGEWRLRESMRKHISWRTGGIADNFYLPADLQDFAQFLCHCPNDLPVHIIGLGSNLLVRDGGIRGAVVVLHARLNDLILVERQGMRSVIYAGAGLPCAKVARFAALHGLTGAEFLAGIPGTVGGALAMNAGCYGAETWEIVEKVSSIDRAGGLHERDPDMYQIGYRHVALQPSPGSPNREEWFVGGWFKLKQGDQTTSRQKIKALLTARIHSQPLNFPNAGSVFRNPPGDYAARLIEASGLKGFSVGGAMVSTKHANFIINKGDAMASDIEAVIAEVRNTVKERTGIELIQEVRIIGDAIGSNR